MLLVPMLSMIFSVILFKEPLTKSSLTAIALVFVGLSCIGFEGLFLKISTWKRQVDTKSIQDSIQKPIKNAENI